MANNSVTVLYFDSHEIMTMKREVLHDLETSDCGRTLLPDAFRTGKVIVAVLVGDVEVLSMTGERTLPEPHKTPVQSIQYAY